MAASATLSGPWAAGTIESEIVKGNTELLILVVADTFVSGSDFLSARQAIIDGFDSNLSEAGGWNAQIRDRLTVNAVTRVSNTTVSVVFPAASGYQITATETITNTIPGSALTSTAAITNTTTIAITAATDGNEITNTDASTDSVNNFNICQRSGFKIRVDDALMKDGQVGSWVRKESYDSRHPQDMVRARPERQRGSVSPEQDDTFISSAISAEDL